MEKMKNPKKANLIALTACGVLMVAITALVADGLALWLAYVIALPVAFLSLIANHDALLISIGALLWCVAIFSSLLSGSKPWRIVSWVTIAGLIVGATVSLVLTTVLMTPRGGM